MASQPALTEVITSAGLTAVPVGRDHRLYQFLRDERAALASGMRVPDEAAWFDLAQDPSTVDWEEMRRGYGQIVLWWWRAMVDTMIDGLVEYCQQWRPDLVIWETITFAGPIAAQACGAVHARQMWAIDLFTRMRKQYLRLQADKPEERTEDVFRQWLAARVGKAGGEYEESMTTGHFTIDSVPPSQRHDPELGLADLGLDYLPMRWIPYHGKSVVPDWLREPPRRRRVALTLGVSSTDQLDGYGLSVPALLRALGGLDVEVVATVAESEQAALGEMPGNVRLVPFVPLNVLAPTCDLVIGHGGNGSYNTTLCHGVPQIVVPFFFDGGLRAEYLRRQGAGIVLDRGEATGELVANAARRVLGDASFSSNAQRLAREMRTLPTPNDLVPVIEERVEKYRRR